MNELPRDFLARSFAPDSTIALLLRAEGPAKTQQRVVTLEQALSPCYLASAFRFLSVLPMSALSLRGTVRHSRPTKVIRSEQDWAWACCELASGKDANKLTHELASRHSDKANPSYYAQRTVHVASARQWFLDNTPIDDVITMLQVRRSSELPAALCSARAREIATTAQRIVARQKFA